MANLSNINNKFLVTTGGNVGINTTSPDSKLDVTGGDITVNTTATGFMNFKYSNSQMGTIGTDGVDLKITANADLQILPASNVGIGTSSPGRKLTIGNGNGFVNNQISLLDGGGTEQATIAVETTTANDLLIASKANLRFFTGSTIGNTTTLPTNERMLIDSSGNVSLNGGLLGLGNAASTPNIGYGMFHYNGVGLGIYSSASGATQGIGFWLNNGSAYEAGRFLSNGNLGIGTTTPSNKLDVKISTSNRTTLEPVLTVSAEGSGPYTGFGPKISFNSNIYYGAATGNPAGIIETAYIGAVMGTTYATNSDLVLATRDGATSVTEKMRILGNGNVGIGTSSPSGYNASARNLVVYSTGNTGITIASNNTSSDGTIRFADGTGGTAGYRGSIQYSHGGDFMNFNTAATERMRIDSSGNVGIGTTSPTRQLHLKRTSGDVRGIMVETTVAASYAEVQVKAAREFRIGTGGSSSDSNASDRFYIFDATAAAHRFTISSTGNVGIGTTSPAQKVEIAGGYLKFSGGDYGIQGSASLTYNPVSDHYFQASGSTKVTIKASGNVGIGETNPQRPLHINGTEGVARFTSTASGNNGFEVGIGTSSQAFLWQAENSYMQFATNNTERMRITSGGDVLISKTSASFTTQGIELRENGQINVAGTVDEFNFYNTSAAAYRFFVTAAGSVHATSTSIVAISDITLKENIKPLETGLNEVMKLKPRRFDWKNGDGKNIAGFIAQEVEEVLPDLVSDYKYTDEETKKALKMGDMIPTLVKSIQELKAEIELLKSK